MQSTSTWNVSCWKGINWECNKGRTYILTKPFLLLFLSKKRKNGRSRMWSSRSCLRILIIYSLRISGARLITFIRSCRCSREINLNRIWGNTYYSFIIIIIINININIIYFYCYYYNYYYYFFSFTKKFQELYFSS